MIKVLFVCHGNICRSPMAEFIFRQMVKEKGLAGEIETASAAITDEEIGNPVYPAARRKLEKEGVAMDSGKRARQVCPSDYREYDLLLGMEGRHVSVMKRLLGGDPEGKIRRLLDYVPHPRDIADPWYSGDFDTAFRDISEGCEALLGALVEEKGRG